MMTKLEIWERVRAHLLAQWARSEDDDGWCRYRDPNGRKCAVGCLIADEHYTPGLEYQNCWRPDVRSALALSGVPTDKGTVAYLCRLQDIHDEHPVSDWPALLDVERPDAE